MQLSDALLGFAAALGLTLAVEAPAAWLLGLRTARGQLCLALVNVVTNPTLNLLTNLAAFFGVYTIRSPLDPMVLALEAAVVAAEALLLKAACPLTPGRAWLLSAVANVASWAAGALLLWH